MPPKQPGAGRQAPPQADAEITAHTEEAWVITDTRCFIDDLSPAAVQMLGVSITHSRQRSLCLFFTSDREKWVAAAVATAEGRAPVQLSGTLQPKDRRPVSVSVKIHPLDDEFYVRWILAVEQKPET